MRIFLIFICFLDAAQLRKQVQGVRKNKGGGRKRTANEAELDDEPANQGARQELVRLEDIEMVYSKRRKDKEAKMEAILKGKIQTRSQSCGSGLIIPDPGSQNSNKREAEFCPTFFCSHKYHKIET
jgi:hypothetical protein